MNQSDSHLFSCASPAFYQDGLQTASSRDTSSDSSSDSDGSSDSSEEEWAQQFLEL